MKPAPTGWRVEWGVTAFAVWQSLPPLVVAWRHSPLDRWGWVALLVWLLPLAAPRPPGPRALWPFTVAVAALVIGILGSLHAAAYLALALTVFGWRGWSPANAVWLLTGLGWMPLLTWLAKELSFPQLLALRFVLVLVGVTVAWLGARRAAPARSPA